MSMGSPRIKSYIRSKDAGILAEKELVTQRVTLHSWDSKGESGIPPQPH